MARTASPSKIRAKAPNSKNRRVNGRMEWREHGRVEWREHNGKTTDGREAEDDSNSPACTVPDILLVDGEGKRWFVS